MWKPEDCSDTPCDESSHIQEDYVESTPHHGDTNCTPCFAALNRFQMLLLRYLTLAESLHLSSPKGVTQTIFRKKRSFTFGKMASLVASSSKMEKGIHLALLKSEPATQHFLTPVIHLYEQVRENQQHKTHIVSACRIENLQKKLPFSSAAYRTRCKSLWSRSRVLLLTFQVSLTPTRVNIYYWTLSVSSFVNWNVKITQRTKNEPICFEFMYIWHMQSKMPAIKTLS